MIPLALTQWERGDSSMHVCDGKQTNEQNEPAIHSTTFIVFPVKPWTPLCSSISMNQLQPSRAQQLHSTKRIIKFYAFSFRSEYSRNSHVKTRMSLYLIFSYQSISLLQPSFIDARVAARTQTIECKIKKTLSFLWFVCSEVDSVLARNDEHWMSWLSKWAVGQCRAIV